MPITGRRPGRRFSICIITWSKISRRAYLDGLPDLGELALADLVQLSFDAESYGHTLIVVRPGTTPDDLLLATHSIDSDNRPLSTYQYSKARFIKITVD